MIKEISPSDFYKLVVGRECVFNNYVKENHLEKPVDKKRMEEIMVYLENSQKTKDSFGEHVKKLRKNCKENDVVLFESELESLLGHISSPTF